MLRILSARILPDYKIWIQYSDGVEGQIDLSYLVGKGIFSAWEDKEVFQNFRVVNGRSVAWTDEMDLCADALYLEMTGKTAQDIFSKLKTESVNA